MSKGDLRVHLVDYSTFISYVARLMENVAQIALKDKRRVADKDIFLGSPVNQLERM